MNQNIGGSQDRRPGGAALPNRIATFESVIAITNRCSRPLWLSAKTDALHGNSAAAILMRRGC